MVGTWAVVVAAGVALAWPTSAGAQRLPAVPIPEDPTSQAPEFIGAPAEPQPVRRRTTPPRHPFMAPNGRSNLHVDAYQTDANAFPGPLGVRMERVSTLHAADCASVTFDSRGRIVSICVGLEGPRLVLLDPDSLDLLATYRLPLRRPGTGTGGANPFTDFAGGGYFYLDHRDRAVIPTTDQRILVVRQEPGPRFVPTREYDLSAVLERDDAIVSALPDYLGFIWFVTTNGVVGHVDPPKDEIRKIELAGEGITNSFSVDEDGGVYVVSDRALYRFHAGRGGAIVESWRRRYDNVGRQKPGQVDDGSGTTPTVMADDYVAITDNADPMKVVVYRRHPHTGGRPRLVCEEPVFRRGASATDNSLIAARHSLVVENNFGYEGPTSTTQGGVTAPGLTRVMVKRDGSGCRTVWESDEISPSVVPKLSLANGLVYAYTKTRDSDDPWYLTAIDFRTGETVFKQLAGFGLGFNNHYAPITIGPDGTAYVGVLGGLVALRDTRSGR